MVAVAGHPVVPNKFTTAFEVAAPDIRRVELQLDGTPYVSIDDLEFDGDSPPPLPTTPPVVQLTQPINNTEVDIPGDLPRMEIAGTVTGEGLRSNVIVTVGYRLPPESTAPPLKLWLSLTGSGPTRQFSLEGGITPLPLGPVTVTAVAENIAGLKGTATSNLTNLPRAVRDRFNTEGGTPALGEFQYGLLRGCSIAVYERGAISGRDGGAIAVRGDIFTKWMSLRGNFNERGWFGCPTGEERDTIIGGARSQPFERGRIYARLPTIAPPEAVYVPAVFAEAIDKRGGDEKVGLPLGDPTNSAGPMQTWLFQRFDRPGDEEWILPSTLEIRGTPPKLWMERQIGKWLIGPGLGEWVFELSAFDQERHKHPATLWEGFRCDDNLGPCPVDPEPEFPPPITPENKPDFKNQFCSGTTYIPGSPWGPPEWKAVRGHHDVTPVFGYTIGAHMASIDNALTHRTHNANCPYLNWRLGINLTCASDFEFFVRPLGQQIVTSPELPSLFGHENTDRIKTEYEMAYAAYAHNFLGAPAVGDLVHTTGRWIVDCGHKTYKTELHPIFSFARSKTVISETNLFTKLEETLFGGKPATRVAIWVNGWYPGGENNAIEFDIFPPPRPSPTSVLHVVKPVDSASGGYRAAVDVNMEYKLWPSHVRLKFTAPLRRNPVSGDGEMLFKSGRQYWGIWYLYWSD